MVHTIRWNQKKVDRLQHIDEIFDRTKGWTHQLMYLYTERKALRIDISRMEPRDGSTSTRKGRDSI